MEDGRTGLDRSMTRMKAVGTSEILMVLLKVWIRCEPIVLRDIALV